MEPVVGFLQTLPEPVAGAELHRGDRNMQSVAQVSVEARPDGLGAARRTSRPSAAARARTSTQRHGDDRVINFRDFHPPSPPLEKTTRDGVRDQRGRGVHHLSPVATVARVWSTDPLERINKEFKRRARVVGIFRP